jgi:hypothetical protein
MITATRCILSVMAVLLVLVTAAVAQDAPATNAEQQAMMEAWQRAMTPGPQHASLAKMAGEFKLTVKMYTDPGAAPDVSTGTASRKMILGGRYLEETVHGTVMGQPFEGHGITGYDNVTGQWWGTWIDSMSTGLMTSHGDWDDEAGVGTFWAESADPMTGKPQKNRTVMRRLEGGDEVMEMYMETPGGEVKSMEILYQRQ